MKKHIQIILLLIGVILLTMIFSNCSGQKISKEIPINLVNVEEHINSGSIHVSGSIKKNLFTKESTFVGQFQISVLEATCRSNVTAKIKLLDKDNQYITFFDGAVFSDYGVKAIKIDQDFKSIEIVCEEFTIISTEQ